MVAALELHIFRILRELEDVLARDRFDIREITSPSTGILGRLRASIPDDISRAQQILLQRAHIIGEAQSEAGRLVRQETVVKEAQRSARETLERAQAEKATILAAAQEVLDQCLQRNREAHERDSQSRALAQTTIELSKALEDLRPAWSHLGYSRRALRRSFRAP